jgi:alpha-galactosidase
LQIFWGATTTLAPDVCLHWSFSQWRGEVPHQTFNPHDPNLKSYQFDFYTRIAMLGAFGISQKLPDLPEWVAERLRNHVAIYQQHVRRSVRDADLHRLTDQPRRSGEGDRWCAFQYSLHAEHLLFIFRLPGAEQKRSIRLKNLLPDRHYQIEGFEGEHLGSMSGRDLMERGIAFATLREGESVLLRLF